MRVIELDASGWETPLDFVHALQTAIGAPKWHGSSLDAFVDSMIWGGVNSVEPPYTVKITKTADIPDAVADAIRRLSSAIREGGAERFSRKGDDVGVSLVAPEL